MTEERALAKREMSVRQPIAVTPAEVVESATTQAKLLMHIVEQTHCYQDIGGEKYLQVEAWETIGAFNRINAISERVTPIKEQEGEIVGYEAEVGLYKDGLKVGAGIMPCYFSEPACRGKAGDSKHKAAMSAAQTFATSKAYRLNFAFVAILAGYQPMPAEELNEQEKSPPVTSGPPPLVKGEDHWCEVHQTKWFKTPNMRSYSHPVKNTDGTDMIDTNGKQVWCREPSGTPPATVVLPEAKSPASPPPASAPGSTAEAPTQPVSTRDPNTIKKIEQLAKALKDDFGLSIAEQWASLGIKDWNYITISPAEAYRMVAEKRGGR